ncbi:MAG: choice-of-anchor Q domain-containing protein [Candidatus Binatus sp.]|uniref:choice-of-anchor Q domain-containing protein n=1 Tax=Candidatus Binatus sp. TaxID=2811406 RepID=UPI00271E59BD|nr:choice-of-anchor Q domain-containing protein [Candidatus Binatus sp.]MDO8432340.1 choice-of-anchor Q domain-containing protein [Candidatus Binatus sp.]
MRTSEPRFLRTVFAPAAILSFSERSRHSPKILLRVIAILFALIALPRIAFANTLTVNTLSDASTSADGSCSLREAINNANNASEMTNGDCLSGTGDDTINFNFSVTGTITLVGSALPTILHTVTIDGAAQNITVSGNDSYQVLVVNSGAALNLETLTVAHGFSASNGGGISNSGTLSVSNSTLSNNSISPNLSGGGIFSTGTLTVTNSTFSGNTATNSVGGGIANTGTLTVTNSTFSGNSAFWGGGIYNGLFSLGVHNGATATISNSTLVNNDAAGGGAVFDSGALVTLTSSTLLGNRGIYNFFGTFNLSKSILANSSNGNCQSDGSAIADDGYSISDDNSCNFGSPTGANGQTLGDHVPPVLDPSGLQNNGGPTQTIALQAGSPAIDAIPLANCPATDQRGLPRPAPGHNACDVGAYEYGSTLADATPPAISIVAPTATTYVLNQSVAASYTCTDPDDAVSLCAGPVADGATIDTVSVGAKTFTVNATDSHSNSVSQSVNYNVAYNICTDYDTSHSKKIGSTVPIKLEICDVTGSNKSASSIVLHATGVIMVSNSASQTLADSGNANPDYDFRFITGPEYIFNLSTSGYPAGTFALQFTVSGDPTSHSALFQLK